MPIATTGPDDGTPRPFDLKTMRRLLAWGLAATAAVTLAVLSAYSSAGAQRLTVAYHVFSGDASGSVRASRAAVRDIAADAEVFRVTEGLRTLAADRDRLAARLGGVERSLDDITGSIRNGQAAPEPASNAAPAKAQDAGPWPAHKPASPEPAAMQDESPAFGVEIGSARTLGAVRSLWATARRRHGPLFANMRPVVTVREPRSGHTELRLVVGPLESASASTRLCASLSIARQHCQAAIFEGQRLVQ